MSTTFDLNHGTDKMSVVPASSPFNYPAYPATPRGPAPFFFRVPFNTPFPFTGTGPLCWELRIASRTNTSSFSHDAGGGAYTFYTQALGTGCTSTGRTALAATTASLSGSNLTVSASQLAANAVAIAVLGFNDTAWSGIPLPLLVPGTTGAPSGPCHVWSDMTVLQVFVASAAGSGSSIIPAVPASPTWVGLRAYSWVLALDAPANPLGVVTTNYRELNWGDGLVVGCRRLYAFNNVSAPTGTLSATAVVVEFLR
jgi:hypothetical protein